MSHLYWQRGHAEEQTVKDRRETEKGRRYDHPFGDVSAVISGGKKRGHSTFLNRASVKLYVPNSDNGGTREAVHVLG